MITRRNALKGISTAAGAALLAPFLSNMVRAQAGPTPRFVFFVEGNGYEPVTVLTPSVRAQLDAGANALSGGPVGTARFWPQRYAHASVFESAGDLTEAPSLANWGELQSKTAVVLGLSSLITGGGHSAYHGALSSRRSRGTSPTGPTIDAVLSQAPGLTGAVFPALRVGYAFHNPQQPRSLDFGTCALAADVAAPLLLQPFEAFDFLFSSATDVRKFARNGTILDVARSDVNRVLQGFAGSSVERAKLQSYLASVEASLNRRTLLSQRVAAIPALPSRLNTRSQEDIYNVIAAQANHIAVALQGGLTHVAVMGIGTGYDFNTFYDATHQDRHDVCHTSEGSTAAQSYLHLNGRLQLEQMLALAQQLEDVSNGDGTTLLDHTVLVYIGDNGETHHALGREFPVVLMGGGEVGLRTEGRSIVYPGLSRMGTSHRQVSNLWATLGRLANIDLNTFGGESLASNTRSAEGVLDELLTS